MRLHPRVGHAARAQRGLDRAGARPRAATPAARRSRAHRPTACSTNEVWFMTPPPHGVVRHGTRWTCTAQSPSGGRARRLRDAVGRPGGLVDRRQRPQPVRQGARPPAPTSPGRWATVATRGRPAPGSGPGARVELLGPRGGTSRTPGRAIRDRRGWPPHAAAACCGSPTCPRVRYDWTRPGPTSGWPSSSTAHAYHAARRHAQRDLRRDAALAALGWVVLRFSYADVTERPAAARRRIAATAAAPQRCPLAGQFGGRSGRRGDIVAALAADGFAER